MKLGDLEIFVLKMAWQLGAGTVKTFYNQVKPERNVSQNTVQSTLERLYRKSILTRHKEGHAYIYQPKLSREAFTAQLLANMVSEFESDPSMTLAAFVEQQEGVSDAKWQHLKAVVEQIKSEDASDD